MSKEVEMLDDANTGESTPVMNKSTVPALANKQQRGFENENEGDLLIPRVKLVQDLSPERKEKIADTGDLVDSLSKELLNGAVFIPVYKYNNNIKWKDRADGGGMMCRSMDGRVASDYVTGETLQCAKCMQCEFDNTKSGKEAEPLCTKYINFLGFIEGQDYPIVVSFCRTYLSEGKKLFSMARLSMEDMWNKKYKLISKKKSKNDNEWFIIMTTPAGKTDEDQRNFGEILYTMFSGKEIKADIEDEYTAPSTIDVDSTEF